MALDATKRLPGWVVPIAAIVFLQTVSAYLARVVPVAAPAFTAERGWDGSLIGYLVAAATVGALLLLTVGADLIRRIGAARTLQLTLMLGALSLALFAWPSIAVALAASLVMGTSNGAMHPAGTEVLQRFTPPAHRNVVFSIKQAGVPMGGVLAGLTIAPLVETAGLRVALLVAAAAVAGGALLTWPLRDRIDGPRGAPVAPDGRRLLRMLAVPLRSLTSGPQLLRVSMSGGLLVVTQSCWFTFIVTYLVVGLGWSLTLAGLLFAMMQATSVAGRILMGWIADRLGSGTATLAITAVVSAAITAVLATTGPGWPGWSIALIAVIAGLSVSSWNGVLLAEIARRSPPELVMETTSGAGILTFTGNLAGPAAVAALVAWTGRFDYAFLAAAICSLLAAALLRGIVPPGK